MSILYIFSIHSIARKLALLKTVIRWQNIYPHQQDDQLHCEILLYSIAELHLHRLSEAMFFFFDWTQFIKGLLYTPVPTKSIDNTRTMFLNIKGQRLTGDGPAWDGAEAGMAEPL